MRKKGNTPAHAKVNMRPCKQCLHEPSVMPAHVVKPPEIATRDKQLRAALNNIVKRLRCGGNRVGVVPAEGDADKGELALEVAGQHRVPPKKAP